MHRNTHIQRDPGSPSFGLADHSIHTGCYSSVSTHRSSSCTLPHKHTLPSPCVEDHPRLDMGTNLSPFVCASCWPGFLRAFPQGQGGEPGWRWVCTPSWLTHLSHWEWLTLSDPEFTVGTGASPRAPWSRLATGGWRWAWPGEWVRRVFAQWTTVVPGTPELWAGTRPSLAQLGARDMPVSWPPALALCFTVRESEGPCSCCLPFSDFCTLFVCVWLCCHHLL